MNAEDRLRSIFRLNMLGRGYTLLAEIAESDYVDCDLGVVSKLISESYLRVQEKIDRFIESAPGRWTLAIAKGAESDQFVVGYGCRFPKADEFGREGVSFIHALICNSFDSAVSAIRGYMWLLAPHNATRFEKAFLTDTDSDSRELIKLVQQIVIREVPRSFSIANIPLKEIGSIKHDCGPFSSLATLLMLCSMPRNDGEWEIFDCVSEKGKIVTKSSLDRTGEVSLSEQLFDMVYEHAVIGMLDTRTSREGSKISTRATNVDDSITLHLDEARVGKLIKEVRLYSGSVFLADVVGKEGQRLVLQSVDGRIWKADLPGVDGNQGKFVAFKGYRKSWFSMEEALLLVPNKDNSDASLALMKS